MKEREQLKNQLVGLNDTIEKMQKEIDALNADKQSTAQMLDAVQLKFEQSEASNLEKDNLITEYEETIKSCKENLESHKSEYESRTKELSEEVSTWKNSYEKESLAHLKQQEAYLELQKEFD